MRLIEVEQRTHEWHAIRDAWAISASNAAVLMGVPHQSGPQNWKQLHEPRKPLEINERMQKGIDFEDKALTSFNEKVGIEHKPILVENTLAGSDVTFGSSLDGHAIGDLGVHSIVEIKIPWEGSESWLWKQTAKGEVPEGYFYQMVFQYMTIARANTVVHFYVYDVELDDGYLITYNAEDIKPHAIEMGKYLRRFINGEEQFSNKDINVLCAEYVSANERYKKSKARRDDLNNKIKLIFAGDDTFRNQFVRGAYYERDSFDAELVKIDYPDFKKEKYMTKQRNMRVSVQRGAVERAIQYILEANAGEP